MNLMELFVKIGVDDQASSKVGSITDKIGSGLKTAADIGVKAVTAASTAIVGLTGLAIKNYSEYEQLAGGAGKIFDEMNPQTILSDAQDAYLNMGLSANQYLAVINDVGAAFASTMGDEKGYEAAKTGLQAISDYASGTGKNVDLLSEKFMMITRSTSSYQSIADQFSGILPATSKDFLAQAQAAGLLSDEYTALTEVPINEYQAAVSEMLKQGVADLGLAGNTAAEAMSTISGSLAATKAAWSNLITGLIDDNADFDKLIDNFVESAGAAAGNLIPRIEVALVGVGKLIDELFPVVMDRIPSIITNTLPSILSSAGNIVMTLVNGIIENAPMILETAINLVITLANGIAQALPNLVPAIVNLILYLVEVITKPETLSALFDAALAIVIALADGLIKSIPTLLRAAVKLVAGVVRGIRSALRSVVKVGGDLVNSFANGINNRISNAVGKAKNLASRVVSAIRSGIGSVASVGANLVTGLWNGVSSKVQWVTQKMASFGKRVIKSLQDFFGIKSPSTLMRDEIGRFLAEGVAVGFMENDPMAEIETSLNNGIRRIDTPSLGVYGGGGYSGSEVLIIQNIYSKAQTAADLMQEAIYQQEKAVYLGV